MPDQPNSVVPTSTSDAPNQLPESDQQSPSLFAQLMANASSGQQSNQPPVQTSPQPQPPTPEQKDAALGSHPAVTGAEVQHKVLRALAGNPTRLIIDPDSGESKREPVPLSGKQLLAATVAQVLGGFGQVSSNLSARMQGRSPQPIKPLPMQQQQQQRDQQSQENWDRVQNQKVRQAKVLTANMEAARVAYGLAHEEEETKRAEVAAHADALANWEKAGTVEASGLSGDDIMKGNRFSKADYFFVPDGVSPLYRNGERVMTNGVPASTFTYSAIRGSSQAELTQDAYDKFVRYGLMKPSKPLSDQGDTFRVPEGSTISGPTLALMNYKVGLVNQLQRELDSVHSAVGGDKVDLASEIRNNPRLLSSVEQWHNADAGIVDDPVRQLASLKASKNPKAQSAADNIASLFGPANLDKYMQMQQDKQAAHAADVAAVAAGKKAGAETTARVAAETTPTAIQGAARKKAAEKAAGEDEDNPTPVADSFGVKITPPTGGAKAVSKVKSTFKKDADNLAQTEGTYNQFSSIKNDINAGKDLTGAQSVVALFNAIGISAEPLKGKGFRINNNTVEEHATARGLGESLYQKLLRLKDGDVITPQQIRDYANIATMARHDAYVNKINEARNQGIDPTFLLPRGNGRQLDSDTAKIYLDAADGNKDAARKVAQSQGWTF